jgi:flavin-dependent dehydrogenase
VSSSNLVPVHERAIVVGASMVGMAAARALSERFREVVLIEKDVLSQEAPEHRRGVQQSYHIHNLTLRGQRELDELFPGFTEEALRLGAVLIDHGRDVARCTNVGFSPLFETGYVALASTRALMEFAERQRLRALGENIRLIDGTRVEDLITEGEGQTLRAVGVKTDHKEHAEIRGQLVVDCSGRAMLWKRWFQERNLPLPEETVVDSRCGYASRFYQVRPDSPYLNMAMTVDPLFPQRPQWGCISPLEGNRWVVTIGGFSEQYPPSDEAGFASFGERFQTPLFQEWLSHAEPITPVRTFRRLEMRWNHFERDPGPVRGFLAVGDSAWAYNPLYGQGMSIGVTCARILRDVLRADPDLETLARRYYQAARRFAFPPWNSTALLDLAWDGTVGKKPWYTELSRRIGHTFLHACHYDDALFFALLQAIHLIKQPYQLLTPRVLFGMVRYWFRRVTSTLPATEIKRLPPRRETSDKALVAPKPRQAA